MSAKKIFDECESNVQTYARGFPRVFNKAKGAEIWDVDGNRYLDFLAGAGSLNYGHNNPVLKQALIDHIESDAITHSLDLHTAAKARFLEAMRDIILKPRGLDYVIQFTGPTGTNAVEAALKLARKATGRTNVICFTNGFHGVSIGSLAATGNGHLRGAAGVPLHGTTVMPYDRYFGDMNSVDYMERLINDPSSGVDKPAAVIVETVQGEGGINAASMDWLKRVEEVCRANNMLMIVDDIQAGCGRTGTFFSFEPAGIKPDIVTMSKSLSGYGLPFAVTLISRALDVWAPGEHNGTFRGNNHAFVTATAALEHYWRSPDFAKEVQAKGDHLGARLQTIMEKFLPHIVEVRGRGLMRGLRCADPKRAAAVTAKAFEHGLIIERSGSEDEVIKFLMPLTISLVEIDEGLDLLERALTDEFGDISTHEPALALSVAAE
ncbi:MAG: diaminobutyrate--2-oxoglutarate transaminase [Geminicoccales bacterium]